LTDLHTHILPGMDDGARNVAMSLAMLEAERAQGVDTVVLTPHFYREREDAERFLQRREAALTKLRDALPEDAPRLIPGAEVAWFHGLSSEPLLEKLCLGKSKYLLLELPYATWSRHLVNQVYQFSCYSGVIPVLAHVERYLHLQQPGQVAELFSLGLPMQLSAEALTRPFQRRKMVEMLKHGEWYIGSDCHNCSDRKPNMGPAAQTLFKRLHPDHAQLMLSWDEE